MHYINILGIYFEFETARKSTTNLPDILSKTHAITFTRIITKKRRAHLQLVAAVLWFLHAVSRLEERQEVAVGDGWVGRPSERHEFEDTHPKRPPATDTCAVGSRRCGRRKVGNAIGMSTRLAQKLRHTVFSTH